MNYVLNRYIYFTLKPRYSVKPCNLPNLFVNFYLRPISNFIKMVNLKEDLSSLQNQDGQINDLLKQVRQQVIGLMDRNVQQLKSQLAVENEQLKIEVEKTKKALCQNEDVSHLIPPPSKKDTTSSKEPAQAESTSVSNHKPSPSQAQPPKKEKPAKKPEKSANSAQPEAAAEVDVRRLDFRIGKIIAVEKHPDADSLYVEKVDVGEEKPRTVVSGLVKFVAASELESRMVVLLCNLKPAKMRGVTSEAMVMCASTPEKVEVLTPPPGCVPGDLVEFEGYPRTPDLVLNPKKKIFESVAPDLKTNDERVACYKGVPFFVPAKGNVTSETLCNVPVK